jgi:hypothetical protein
MVTKLCKICKIEKEEIEYLLYKSKGKFYRDHRCDVCRKEYNRNYSKNNKNKLKEYSKNYYLNNLDLFKEYRENNAEKISQTSKMYRIKNRDRLLKYDRQYNEKNKKIKYKKHNEWEKNRKNIDPVFKLRLAVSRTIAASLKDNNSDKNGKSVVNNLSYSISDLKQHLESLFEPWMTWSNYGKYSKKSWNDKDINTWKWNIDHIIPQSDLLYNSMEDENFKKCWALNNLRPLSAKQNLLDGCARSRHLKKTNEKSLNERCYYNRCF